MAYIGAKVGTLVTAGSSGDVTVEDATPEVTLKNTTETDADGSRGGKITFKGEQSGGEQSTLAQIVGSHDTALDNEAGDLIFKTNDGNDGASPTEVFRLDSKGHAGFGGAVPNVNIHAATFPASLSVGTQGVILGNSNSLQIGANYYWNGSGYKYLGSGKASRNYHSSGNVVWEIEETSGSTDGAISFSEKARINEHGLCFNGDTAAANALDGYEEGTFTATLVGYYGSPSTAVTSTGQYTKVGNQVSFWINMENKDTTGASGNMWISGLPFASSGNYEMCMAEMSRAATFTNSSPFGLVSGTIVYFYSHASAALSNVIHHNAGTGRTIRVSGTYRVA